MHFTRTAILLAALATPAMPLVALAQPQPAAVARTAETVSIIEAVDQRDRLGHPRHHAVAGLHLRQVPHAVAEEQGRQLAALVA